MQGGCRNPLLIGSTVLTVRARYEYYLLEGESQSPPNRVNGSHDTSGIGYTDTVDCRNPLLIGSTVLTMQVEHNASASAKSRNPLLIGSTVLTMPVQFGPSMLRTGRNPLLIGSTVLTNPSYCIREIIQKVAIPS